MQAISSTVNTPGSRPAGTAQARSATGEAAALAAAGQEQRPLRVARQDWNPDRNQQTADAQRTLEYLERMSTQLQQLKNTLSAQLVSQRAAAAGHSGVQQNAASNGAAAEQQLQSLDDLWRQREMMTGGSLDSQLRFIAEGTARRRFSIRGLDTAALAGGERETLSFSVGQGRSGPVTVTLEPGATLQDNVKKLDRALAPLGIGVGLNGAGDTVFSVPESQWAQVRDALAIKGGGIRLPGGQAHRARTEVQEEAITPTGWSTGDATALRNTLQEVTQALEHVRRVAQQVRETLERAKQATAQAADAAWASAFAAEFGERAQAPDYEVYAAIAPALVSVNRSRVVSLLTLK
ncbi:hypothetical protein [Aquincola tertiaricarbonis]|uniref:hypothetical protein n=1 Tax=Aquincola tertiaricarbonis TaxID=391953 RepID=UPI000697D9D1|nr:hypothetical protein [Aquincola tertiaricarbonis]